MASAGRALIFIEDGSFIYDNRVKREARTLEAAGFDVSVICPRYPGEAWADDVGRTHVYRYPKIVFGGPVLGHVCEYASSLLFGGLAAIWVAMRRGFDVIHLCNPPDFLFPIALFFKLFGKRYVFDHHDVCPELYEAQYGKRTGALYRILLWAERQSLSRADGVLSTNESYRRVAIERCGVSPERILVVRNGPDLARFPPCPEPVRRPVVRVGYIGNMNPQDGVDRLLLAAKHIVIDLQRRDIEFVLIGKGDSFASLSRLAADLALEGAVRFTGRISDEDVLQELSACDIGCQPDPLNPLNDISTMNKVMEYMALGKPVVAFDLVETRVSCGDAAFYAADGTPEALAREIVRLADDFELRREMGLRGRRRIEEKLAWKYSEAPLITLYRQVLGLEETKSPQEEPVDCRP
ncbi:MAG TPA: glycosyltransferase family 4 protein [Planctomycetota bacterium]|nr:glycosyltransferase family 4 protein [Planctomycetota bacterium]